MIDKPVTIASRYQTIVLHSESGAGKTSLSATAPRALFADSNKGLLSIAERPGLEHVRSVDVGHMKDLDRIYANCTGTGKKDWRKKYDTIVFDHWDDMQGFVLDDLVEKAMELDDRRDDTVEQREYGIMGNKLRRYIRKFKRVPMHKIFICGSKPDNDTGQLIPSLIGALSYQMKYLVDHTMFLRIGKNGVRYLHLDPTEDFYAKTRAHWIPPEERKIRVDFNDMQTLTNLFDRIAAGPKRKSKTAKN